MRHPLHPYRTGMTEEFGASSFDLVVEHWRCPDCSSELPGALSVIPDSHYGNLPEFVEFAQQVVASVGQGEEPLCEGCERAGEYVGSDYHGYHEGRARDLVARCHGEAVETGWWSEEAGFEAVSELSDEEQLYLALGVLCRRAAFLGMNGEVEELVETCEDALAQVPGHPLLLELLRPLLEHGRANTAGQIAQTHVLAHPDDPRGHAWVGEILSQCINYGAVGSEGIEDALGEVRKALELDPDMCMALMTRSALLRMAGDEAAARADLSRVIELDEGDDAAAAHYNLGVLDLASDPSAALEHFSAGRALDPEDPDYVLGAARAFAALGQPEEAAAALAEAEELAPDYPRIAETRAELEGEGEAAAANSLEGVQDKFGK